jgi:hypothetical protein
MLSPPDRRTSPAMPSRATRRRFVGEDRDEAKTRCAEFLRHRQEAIILGRITQLDPTYGRVNSIERGRLVTLGVSVEF